MTVHRIDGEDYRFFVESDRPTADRYLCDLEPYDGNGWCGCKHFEMKCWPKLERGERPTTEEELKCKHLIRAHIFQSMELALLIRQLRHANSRQPK